MGPVDVVVVAAAAGERWRLRRRRFDFGFFKKRVRKLLQNSHCLLKQKAWLLTAGRKSF